MSGPFRFGPDELGETEGSELDDALEAVGALEVAASDAPAMPGAAFSDRVMAALADEPSPAPTGFLIPLRHRGLLAGFRESVRQAWASLGAGRPAFARAAALAYVLVVVIAGTSIAGLATLGAAGALGLLGPHESVTPSPEPTVAPVFTPTPQTPAPSTNPSIEPLPSPTESEGPDDHGGGSGPEPSDDHGGDSGSGDGSDDSSSGSGSGDSGASATDDHSGSDDGSRQDD